MKTNKETAPCVQYIIKKRTIKLKKKKIKYYFEIVVELMVYSP